MNRPHRQRTPAEIIRRKQTRRILWIASRDVDRNALEDDKDPRGKDSDADNGDDPVEISSSGPAKEEEADGRQDDGEEGWFETVLLRGRGGEGAEARVEVEVEVSGVDRGAEDASDDDTDEDEAELAEGEAIEGWIDEGEGFKEAVVDAVDEGGIKVHEGDGGVFVGDFEGFDQRAGKDGARGEVRLGDFAGGEEARGRGHGTETLGAAEEDCRGVCFGQEEVKENADRASELWEGEVNVSAGLMH